MLERTLTPDRLPQRRSTNGARPQPPRVIADNHPVATPTLNLLADAVAAFAAAADVAELGHALARRLARVASAEYTTVWLSNASNADGLTLAAVWPTGGQSRPSAQLQWSDAPCVGEVYGTGAALRARLSSGPAALGLNGRRDSPVWVVPLSAGPRRLGLAYVVPSRAAAHDSDVGRVLTILGAQAALAAQALCAQNAARQEDAEFLAVVAHDLKNVATSIKGYTQLLRRHLPGESAPRAGRWAGIVEEQVGALTGALSAVVDLGRLRAGRLALDRQPTDLCAVVDAAVVKVPPADDLPALGAQSPGVPVEGLWDSGRLERALGAALDSLRRSAPPESPPIIVDLECDEARARLRIGTTCGDAFWPEAGEWAASAEATLYLLRGVVEAHGGWAAFHRTAGGEPRLQVSLPL